MIEVKPHPIQGWCVDAVIAKGPGWPDLRRMLGWVTYHHHPEGMHYKFIPRTKAEPYPYDKVFLAGPTLDNMIKELQDREALWQNGFRRREFPKRKV